MKLNRRQFINTAASTTLLLTAQGCLNSENSSKPNILWLTIEDSSYYEFGCYGNEAVKTPNIDSLAQNGVQFLRAWSTAPQCSPARASLISGCHATTYGTDYHRLKYSVPAELYFFPHYLQKAGYFCTNNHKTDYNTKSAECKIWDECSSKATYNNRRRRNKPFFSVFNLTLTHMRRVRSFHLQQRRDFTVQGLDPKSLQLPPHLPDLPEVRSDYAFHLEGIQDADRWVGLFLEDLQEKNLAENTIVFFFSDHGGILPRGKGFVYETGLRVPLIAYFPPKWQHLTNWQPGTQTKQLVSFVDLAPTVLSLAEVKPPENMQGKAFAGSYAATPAKIQFGFRSNQDYHFDPSRTATDGTFKYIRNYIPYLPSALRNFYQWGVPSYQAWDRYVLENPQVASKWQEYYQPKPAEMLFNIEQDPYELGNLAQDEAYQDILLQLRSEVARYIRNTKDLGFLITSVRGQKQPLYNWVRESNYPHESLMSAVEIASENNSQHLQQLLEYLKSDRAEFRFWGASGLTYLAQRKTIKECPSLLIEAMKDPNEQVAATAAIGCCFSGCSDLALSILVANLEQKKIPAYSALECISLYKEYCVKLQTYSDKFQKLAKLPSDGTLTDRGLAVRSILVNLQELPISQLYPQELNQKGSKINRRVIELLPKPF